jgi:uncharacterized SAM-binding protein YcdF (DUF218 family)
VRSEATLGRVIHASDWGIVVPGHSCRGLLTDRCRRLVDFAAGLAEEHRPQVVVFTGWSPSGGISEAEQMLDEWPGRRDVELITEPTARTTAENASRSLPFLLRCGVADVTVVCAPLHAVRVRYFFGALHRRFGLRLEVASAPCRPTAAALARELAAFGVMRRQRRAALAELETAAGES